MVARKVPGDPDPDKAEDGTTPEANDTAPNQPGPKSAVNPFDVENLRLDPREVLLGPKKEVQPVLMKPRGQMYFRARPGAEHTLTTALLKVEGESGNNRLYVLSPELRLALAHELKRVTIYTCVTTAGDVLLWPISAEPGSSENRWISSCYEAVELAMERWTRITSNTRMGMNDIVTSTSNETLPVWPDLTLSELLSKALKGCYIENPEHVVLQRLAGKFV